METDYYTLTGYPEPIHEPDEFCCLCGKGIWVGEMYYDTPHGFWCKDCVSMMQEMMD